MRHLLKFSFIALILLFTANISVAQTSEKGVTIIELVQTPGQFETQALNLKPGKYQFRIVNKGVDKEVGFVIQESSDVGKDVMKNHVDNSFSSSLIKNGDAAYTGIVDLSKGTYSYVCPLNPTPHYTIKVN